MRILAVLMIAFAPMAVASERLSLGDATPDLNMKQLEAAVHGSLKCKHPEQPLKPLDATDQDCLKTSDLAHSGFFSGSAGNHPISFVYRFRHGRLGAIYVLGLKPPEYTALLSGLVAKFSTPDRVSKTQTETSSGGAADNQWDAWTNAGNVLELRQVASTRVGAGLRLTAKWYREEAGRSGEAQSADGS
jgi:hypothetical protein